MITENLGLTPSMGEKTMYSAMIVDDEVGIIQLIRTLIEYPGVTIVGEATDGEEALRLITEKRPDLVITDIHMPGMDGLEMIERAKKIYPPLQFVVISGYRKFEYAQTAFRHGVYDYLLKPIKKQELNKLLEQVDEKLNHSSAHRAELVSIQKNLQQSLDALRRSYLDMLLRPDAPVPELPLVDGQPVFRFGQGPLLCLLLKMDIQDAGALENPAIERLLEELCRRVAELAGPLGQDQTFLIRENTGAFLLDVSLADEEARSAFAKALRASAQELNYKFNFLRVTAGLSRPFPDLARVKEAVAEARFALECRIELVREEVIVFPAEACVQVEAQRSRKQDPAWDTLCQAVERLDAPAARAAMLELWHSCLGEIQHPGMTWACCQEVLEALYATLAGLSDLDIAAFPAYGGLDAYLENGAKAQVLRDALASYVEKMVAHCSQLMESRENKFVREAKAYIEAHYAESIGLNDMARQVCLSPTYFSALFKTETGQGFLNYLQAVRIQKAKLLLRQTRMSVAAIAGRVGYSDVKHFTRLFAKETGAKPSEYRKFYS